MYTIGRWRGWAVVPLLVAAGCSGEGYRVAPVSGVLTLDGKPLAAFVQFSPMAAKGNLNPGPTSYGKTDQSGRYSLVIETDKPGAVVGKHSIWISTFDASVRGAGGQDQDAGAVKVVQQEKVPAKYNGKSELTFDVPAGGTDQANFDLKSN